MNDTTKVFSTEEKAQPQTIPTASAVCHGEALVELVYDPRKRRTTFVVWKEDAWTLEDGFEVNDSERLVPFKANNNLIKNEVVLLPSRPEEYGTEENLLHDIRSFIHRYVDVSPLFEKVASYYVLLSWIYDAFNELPYLRLRGDYGTGKTRFLRTVGSLCYKAFFASGASTISPILHTLDAFRGTLIIDEGDFRFSDEKAEIVKILNNGNVRGMPVLRTMVGPNREFNPRAFQVFGPKLVATRGYYDDRALESRFITEEMGQRRLRDDVPINLRSSYKEEALQIRNKLLLYRLRNFRKTKADEALVDSKIEPRLNQIFVPLLSVIGQEAVREEIRAVAWQCHRDLVAERGMDMEAQLLEVIRDLFKAGNRSGVPIKDITARFIERYGRDYEQNITSKWVGTIIRRKLRVNTHKSHGVFVVPLAERSQLELLYEKYALTQVHQGPEPQELSS